MIFPSVQRVLRFEAFISTLIFMLNLSLIGKICIVYFPILSCKINFGQCLIKIFLFS